MAKVLKLTAFPTIDVELDHLRFKLRGLSREEVYDYILSRHEDFEKMDAAARTEAMREFEDELLNLAVVASPEEVKQEIIDKIKNSSYETYQKILQTIMSLSGVGEPKK